MQIGLVGLGRMGAAIAKRLVEHGFSVTAWDLNAASMRAAEGLNVSLASSAAAAAEAGEIVVSTITDDQGVRALFTGPAGFLSAEVKGKLFVEMSTLQPVTTRELTPLVEPKGARLIDVPVLGTIPSVLNGTLVALAGGRADDVERARIVLDKLARKIVHMGPAGSGHAMKLAVNLGLGSYIQAIAESLALGAKQGLDLNTMIEVLQDAPYASGWLAGKTPVLKGASADVTLDIQTLRKDLASAVATGTNSGVPMPLSSGALTALSAAVAGGMGPGDLAELPKFLREHMALTSGS